MINKEAIDIIANMKVFFERNEPELITVYYKKTQISEALNRALLKLREYQAELDKNPELQKEIERIIKNFEKKQINNNTN